MDSAYIGELMAVLYNVGDTDYVVAKYDRIAQLVVAPVHHVVFTPVKELAPTDRGEAGFGSSGANVADFKPVKESEKFTPATKADGGCAKCGTPTFGTLCAKCKGERS